MLALRGVYINIYDNLYGIVQEILFFMYYALKYIHFYCLSRTIRWWFRKTIKEEESKYSNIFFKYIIHFLLVAFNDSTLKFSYHKQIFCIFRNKSFNIFLITFVKHNVHLVRKLRTENVNSRFVMHNPERNSQNWDVFNSTHSSSVIFFHKATNYEDQ